MSTAPGWLSEAELDELLSVVNGLYLDEMRAMKPHPPGRITLEEDETVADYGDLKMLIECAAALPALIAQARAAERATQERIEWVQRGERAEELCDELRSRLASAERERDRYKNALERIDLQPDEIGLEADNASEAHQACWHMAHEALRPDPQPREEGTK